MIRKPITPKTKVAELLNDYPELEDALIEISPEFSKLKNPILRNTVAKIATLEQAASMAELPIGDVVNRLRELAGFEELDIAETGKKTEDFPIDEALIESVFDARPIVNAGGHPMHEVIELMDKLSNGKMLELITPFVPAPLVEIGRNRGLKVKTVEIDKSTYKTYYCKC